MTSMKVRYLGDLRTECIHVDSGAKILTDAPKDNQGKGESFSPTDLFAVSLGSCILTIMGIAAKKHGFDLEGATADVEKQMVVVPSRRVGKIIIRIRCSKLPPPQIQEMLEEAALHCPVHSSLPPEVLKEIDFVWGI